MNVNIITLYEGHHHLGVAAMVNSLVKSGFRGKVSIYYKGDLPPWTGKLSRVQEGTFQVGEVTLTFLPAVVNRHFGYHKPFAALEEFRRDPDCEAVVYVDPDIVFLAPWSFFEGWLPCGLALCLDMGFPFISQNHPWRKTWAELLLRGTGEQPNTTEHYVNSGFVGGMRKDIDFFQKWAAVTEAFEAGGGNTAHFEFFNRCQAVVGDQDLLAATLMGWKGKTSILGQEGMGFSGQHIYLSHDIDQPKPWVRSYVQRALRGVAPSAAAGLYFQYANAPIAPYSPMGIFWKKLTFRVAQLISRVWSRP